MSAFFLLICSFKGKDQKSEVFQTYFCLFFGKKAAQNATNCIINELSKTFLK
jgi:hypothetical protein